MFLLCLPAAQGAKRAEGVRGQSSFAIVRWGEELGFDAVLSPGMQACAHTCSQVSMEVRGLSGAILQEPAALDFEL